MDPDVSLVPAIKIPRAAHAHDYHTNSGGKEPMIMFPASTNNRNPTLAFSRISHQPSPTHSHAFGPLEL